MEPSGQRTVLVIEDEDTLRRALSYNLTRDGFTVLTARDGIQGRDLALNSLPDLVVLDLMLPRMDGLDVCRAIRLEGTTPILMLTAKVEEVDRIVGLEIGADDYLTKPFSMRELIARVRALLRRVEMNQRDSHRIRPRAVLTANNLELDQAAHRFTNNGKVVPLRRKEFDLLAFLLENRGVVFSRDALLERIWGYDYSGDTRTVDVHVRWLREKIEEDPGRPTQLVTIRGVGYKFEA